MSPERRRLTLALLLSLLIHTLLLSLIHGGQGLGLPGFGLPWQDRRIQVHELRVVLVPAQATAAEPAVAPAAQPWQQAWVERPIADGPALTPSVPSVPTTRRTTEAIVPQSDSKTDAGTDAAPATTPLRADRPGDTAPQPISEPASIPLAQPDEAPWVAPAIPAVPTPALAAAPSASSPETAMPPLRDAGDAARARIDQEARERAVELAALARARQEAQAEQLEAARQEAARQEAARVEAARQKAERQEATRQAAARQEATRQEAAQQEAARNEAARVEVAQEAAARREAVLRAIGRQLDEEADRREAASAAARLSPSLASSSSSARRGRLFGRTDPNAELILYAEAWSRKIQLNMTFDMVREAVKQPHTDPLVTVAIRSDGSVESVTFVRSSGVSAIDEAIRRIVHSQVPYQAFPPGLTRDFDVIEIRRAWHFDMAIRLY